MNNLDILAVREFRRFINQYIYPTSSFMIMEKIKISFNPNQIYYEQQPQSMIKFDTSIISNPLYTENIGVLLNGIFIDFFNNYDIIKLIRHKIYNEIMNEEVKQLLNKALYEILLGNFKYLSHLFNVTILENNIYLYL